MGTTATGRMRPIGIIVAAVLALAVGIFAFGSDAQNANEIIARTQSGQHRLTIEWAATVSERAKGLMERQSLPKNHGMLFDFGFEQPVEFWMKNTPLSLDMVFITGDGTVYRIERGTKPYSLDVIPGGAPVRYVLEVEAGESERIGLKPGDRIEIPKR